MIERSQFFAVQYLVQFPWFYLIIFGGNEFFVEIVALEEIVDVFSLTKYRRVAPLGAFVVPHGSAPLFQGWAISCPGFPEVLDLLKAFHPSGNCKRAQPLGK